MEMADGLRRKPTLGKIFMRIKPRWRSMTGYLYLCRYNSDPMNMLQKRKSGILHALVGPEL